MMPIELAVSLQILARLQNDSSHHDEAMPQKLAEALGISLEESQALLAHSAGGFIKLF